MTSQATLNGSRTQETDVLDCLHAFLRPNVACRWGPASYTTGARNAVSAGSKHLAVPIQSSLTCVQAPRGLLEVGGWSTQLHVEACCKRQASPPQPACCFRGVEDRPDPTRQTGVPPALLRQTSGCDYTAMRSEYLSKHDRRLMVVGRTAQKLVFLKVHQPVVFNLSGRATASLANINISTINVLLTTSSFRLGPEHGFRV